MNVPTTDSTPAEGHKEPLSKEWGQALVTCCEIVIYKKYIFYHSDDQNTHIHISHVYVVFVQGSFLAGPKTLGIS